MPLKLKIVSKNKLVFEGEADFCEIPTEAGIEGILPKHINFISNLAEGQIKYRLGEKSGEIDITGGGFVEVSSDNVNIMINS